MRQRIGRKLWVEQLERRVTPTVFSAGNEFRVNSFTSNTQNEPAVAMDADGEAIVVWTSFGQDGDQAGIYGRRYDTSGAAVGNEFQVNTYTTSNQTLPRVASDGDGDFVVVWSSFGQDGAFGGIVGQRFSAAGAKVGSEFLVNQTTGGIQTYPDVAMDSSGRFTVVWESGQNIFARRYDANGLALTDEFVVNTFTGGNQIQPAIAMNPLGASVIAWSSFGQDGDALGVYAQRYTSAGAATGGEFQVNTVTTGEQSNPDVAVQANGKFVVTWQGFDRISTTSDFDIVFQRYDASGVPLGEEGFADSGFQGAQIEPSIAISAIGRFAITDDTTSTSTGAGVIPLTVFDSTGGTYFSRQPVSTTSTGARSGNAMASDAQGNLFVVWTGSGSGDTTGIFARRFTEDDDDALPWVTGLYANGSSDIIEQDERITYGPTTLTVAFSEAMSTTGGATGANSVTNPANWSLTGATISTIAFGFNSTTRRHEAILTLSAALPDGDHTLTAGANLRDAAGKAIGGTLTNAAAPQTLTFRVNAPGPVGGEFLVNTITAGNQSFARVAAAANGDFVVVWQSDSQEGGNQGVYGQRYSAAGVALGSEFRASSITTGNQFIGDVAADAAGNFVVVWEDAGGRDGASSGVFAQRYSAAGTALGINFRVNTFTAGSQGSPRVAMAPDGQFVVAWDSANQDGNSTGIVAQRYAADGSPRGGEIAVNTFTTGSQNAPAVAIDAGGNFVVTWTSAAQDGSSNGVYARRFTADGLPGTTEFRVNTFTSGDQSGPSVAADLAGNFIVVWQSAGQDGDSNGVYGQRYSVAGVPVGAEFRLNATTIGNQRAAQVAMDRDGDFVATWTTFDASENADNVFVRRYRPDGVAAITESLVNTFTTGNQGSPALASDADGDFIVAWTSDGQDGSSNGIYAQRFAAAPPPRVASVTINAGQANATQRSRVTSVSVTFDAVVAFAGTIEAAFGLSRIGGGAVGGFTATAAIVNGVTVVTLTNFSGAETAFGSLVDGRFRVLVRANQVTAGGHQLDGDGNSTGGDDFALDGTTVNGLFRLYGDANGDGIVNAFDFSQFRNAFGSSTGQTAYLAFLDFNDDGVINAFDFGQFRPRFGAGVP